ncbi:Uu.00g044750.m01.CDS01 [Anthostomella pinea]|uniref:Uu.00g044750.m01.CDS01 n=1 Tax=Anthostomella pinea TaxID=933095 RepID=A0AAI8VBJ0_9PEZI|nr:Uu.00g044750.m01.CDS01 [Anthostomella pinea]
MYNWYKDSAICYAYLEDVSAQDDVESSMRKSRWFTRGWTLQELLAPSRLVYYDGNWLPLGSGTEKRTLVLQITGIPESYLSDELSEELSDERFNEYIDIKDLSRASIAQRMSWLSRRQTTRVEDMAYCMLGIFDLNMPLLYGEGSKAFLRLQEELIRVSNDHTIFCWNWIESIVPPDWASMLSPAPAVFEGCGHFVPAESDSISTFSMTNSGLSIQLGSVDAAGYVFVILNARNLQKPGKAEIISRFGIPLRRSVHAATWARQKFPPSPTQISRHWISANGLYYVARSESRVRAFVNQPSAEEFNHGILLTFENRALAQLGYQVLEVEGCWDSQRSVFFLNPVRHTSASRGIFGFEVWRSETDMTYRNGRLTISFVMSGSQLRLTTLTSSSGYNRERWHWKDGSWHQRDRSQTRKSLRKLTDGAFLMEKDTESRSYSSLRDTWSYSEEADATVATDNPAREDSWAIYHSPAQPLFGTKTTIVPVHVSFSRTTKYERFPERNDPVQAMCAEEEEEEQIDAESSDEEMGGVLVG